MPTWLYVAFWVIWILLTAEQLIIEILIARENKSELQTLMFGRTKRNDQGRTRAVIWFVFTIFWLSYIFFG